MNNPKLIIFQMYRFALVGAFGSVLNYSTFYILLTYFNLHYLMAGVFTRVNHLAHPDPDVRKHWVDWFKHYVGTSINYLIEQGKKVVIFDIDQWISFGDPFELQVLEYWDEHFNN